MSTTPGTRLDSKTIRVRARYDDDTAARGDVIFNRTGGPLRDNTEHEFLLPKEVKVTLDNEGEGATTLWVTDDPDLNPSGFTWTATFSIPGVTWPSFTFALPRSTPSPVWLDVVAPSAPSSPSISYFLSTDPKVNMLKPGGTTGQALVKASNTDYDVNWANAGGGGTSLPNGGTTGQALVKTSGVDQAVAWGTPTVPNPLPTGGSTGQVLSKTSATDYATTWSTPASTAASISYAGGPDLTAGTVEAALDSVAGRTTVVNNGTNPTPTRPSGVSVVVWTGTVRPTASMTASDIYVGDIGAGGAVTFGTPTGSVDLGDAADAGVASGAARADHQHPFPAPSAGYPVAVAGTSTDGSATTPARSDHRHALGTALVTDTHVAAGANIARSKLGLAAPDSAAATASERTLGSTATSAAAGNLGFTAKGQIAAAVDFGGTVTRGALAPGANGQMMMYDSGMAFGMTPVEGVRVVRHGTNATTARPVGGVVYWIGTATPSNFQAGDIWNDAP